MAAAIPSLQLIASPRIGGAETSFLRLGHALERAGHAVHSGVRDGSELHRRLADEPRLHAFPLRNYLDVVSMAQIRRVLEEQRLPLVQTWASRATWLTHAPAGVTHVARLGGYYKLRYFRHADGWIANTRGLRDWMVDRGFPPERVEWINNFVPELAAGVAPVHTRASLGIDSDALMIVALGRFVEKKGFGDLLHAFAQLPERIGGRRVHLVLIGDGPLLAELRATAGSLAARVHFTGWLDQPLPLLAQADLFVCPSRVEPLGNVVLEAWSQGVAVICTETDGGTELIRAGDTGLLSPAQDVPRLAAQIQRALADGELRAALAAHGLTWYRQHYSEQKTLDATLDFYRRLMRRVRVRRR